MKARVVQSKHVLDEELLVNIWRRSSAPHPDDCFNDWRRQPKTDLGVFSSDLTFFWANWVRTNKGLIPVFDVGEPTEWRSINLEEKASDVSDTPDAIESRLNYLATRLAQLKQRGG